MKKVIPIICMLALLLCACTQNEKPPVQSTDTSFDAVYEAGDFSFNCNIKWQKGTAFVSVYSTAAAGLTLSCDGREVTFSKDAMMKKESKDRIDPSNPALLLWEIFTALENGSTKTSLGDFEITYDDSGNIHQIKVSDITITNSARGE